MRPYPVIGIVILFCQLIISPERSAEAPKKVKAPEIEPKATEVLKQMCDYLKNLQHFFIQAEITEDVLLTSGQRIQYSRNVEASVRRPDHFRAESVGDTDNREFFYDGKTITLMDRSKNFYTTMTAPPEIDAALEHGIKAFNLRAPLADLIYTKAFEYLTEGALSAFYVGLSKVQGVTCHHLAFREKDIDGKFGSKIVKPRCPESFSLRIRRPKGYNSRLCLPTGIPLHCASRCQGRGGCRGHLLCGQRSVLPSFL